jgi:hypothetical protein
LLLYPITGNTADYHPADTNKDWQISLEEFNAYNTAWRQGNDWPESVNPIPNTYVARAGFLYKKGKCYHEHMKEAPMNWDSDQDCDRTIDLDDGCPDDPNKIEPGGCGCGHLETGNTVGSSPEIDCANSYSLKFENNTEQKEIKFFTTDREASLNKPIKVSVENLNLNIASIEFKDSNSSTQRLKVQRLKSGTCKVKIKVTDADSNVTEKTISIEIKIINRTVNY